MTVCAQTYQLKKKRGSGNNHPKPLELPKPTEAICLVKDQEVIDAKQFNA